MTVAEIMTELEAMGSDGIKKILLKHGVKEPFFGVKVEQLKTIQKKIKKDYQLAKDLYATGNADAMYLAGLIADDEQMTTAELNIWAEQAESSNISEYTVPWVTAGNSKGFELALQWIDDEREHVAAAGWSALSNIVSLWPDHVLDMEVLKKLLKRVTAEIHTSKNRVRATMNVFIISVGTYVHDLYDLAIATANQIGVITVIKEGTACKTPDAVEYINKAKARAKGLVAKKKMVKC